MLNLDDDSSSNAGSSGWSSIVGGTLMDMGSAVGMNWKIQ
jgi:hypothetical protein